MHFVNKSAMFLKRTKQHVSLFVPENKINLFDDSFKCIFLNENV